MASQENLPPIFDGSQLVTKEQFEDLSNKVLKKLSSIEALLQTLTEGQRQKPNVHDPCVLDNQGDQPVQKESDASNETETHDNEDKENENVQPKANPAKRKTMLSLSPQPSKKPRVEVETSEVEKDYHH